MAVGVREKKMQSEVSVLVLINHFQQIRASASMTFVRPLLSLLAVFTPSVTTRSINLSEYDKIQDASMTCVRLLVVRFLFYLFLHFFFSFPFFPFGILVELL